MHPIRRLRRCAALVRPRLHTRRLSVRCTGCGLLHGDNRDSMRLSHKSKALEISPTKTASATPTPPAAGRNSLGGTPVLGHTDNERPPSPTYATATRVRSSALVRRRNDERSVELHGIRAVSALLLLCMRAAARPAGIVLLLARERWHEPGAVRACV
jgi:hypothetical protein